MTPRFMKPSDAAQHINVCPDTLKRLRMRDRDNERRGRPLEGPPWAERRSERGKVEVAYDVPLLEHWAAESYWMASGSSPPARTRHAKRSA